MSNEQPQPIGQEWLTTSQVSEKYGVAKKTVYRWSYEKKVVTKVVDRELFISRPSIDAMIERQKEAKKTRGSVLGQMAKIKMANEVPIIDQGEVERLKKQLQDSNIENSRLKGSLEVYEKELDRMYTIIQNLLASQR